VLLVDAGDMWQGTLESNLGEGAPVVAVYNAMGYAAAAIGNHEFDFGPVGDKAIPETDSDDPQGALRQRITELEFPALAANLIDTATNRRVDWENVRSSTMVSRAGIDIGIIGVITEGGLRATIAANTKGLRIGPLAETITSEARLLRAQGADLVVVVSHAGSRCEKFDDPFDLSSCVMRGEIMRAANDIPAGLVDHIVAGHVHQGIAHVVNGIVITSSYSRTSAFSRVDFTFDGDGNKIGQRIYPPQANCAKTPDESDRCAYEKDATRAPATYEGRQVVPSPAVAAIAARASDVVTTLKAEKVGVTLDTAFVTDEQPESSLGNLFTDAVRESTGADIALHNVYGGIRANMSPGEVTFGTLYRVFPFDNRIAIVEMSGADLRKIIAVQAPRPNRRVGFSGMRVFIGCDEGQMSVQMMRPDNTEIADSDVLRVVANDFLLMGGDGMFVPVAPEGGFDIPSGTPLVRDKLVEWFKRRGGSMKASDFRDPENLRWNVPTPFPEACTFLGQ
jgi:5'-nucleotidase